MIPRVVIGTEFGFKNRKTEQIKPNTKNFSVFKTERPKIFGSETENQNRINLTLKIFGFKTENFRFLKPKKPKNRIFLFWTLTILSNSDIFTDF